MRKMLAVGVALLVLAGCGTEGGSDSAVTTTAVATTTTVVSVGKRIRDLGNLPLSADVETTQDSATIVIAEPSGPNMTWLEAVLDELGLPAGTIDLMEQTRALDGMQDAEGGGFSARWTYHPDDGLSVVIQRKP